MLSLASEYHVYAEDGGSQGWGISILVSSRAPLHWQGGPLLCFSDQGWHDYNCWILMPGIWSRNLDSAQILAASLARRLCHCASVTLFRLSCVLLHSSGVACVQLCSLGWGKPHPGQTLHGHKTSPRNLATALYKQLKCACRKLERQKFSPDKIKSAHRDITLRCCWPRLHWGCSFNRGQIQAMPGLQLPSALHILLKCPIRTLHLYSLIYLHNFITVYMSHYTHSWAELKMIAIIGTHDQSCLLTKACSL